MGETSAISWTDATFNPWIGCTKVSQGCKFCYAETQNNRYQWNPAGWGPGAPRKRTSEANWKKPIAWAKQAVKDGVTRRVFCASLADVFDAEVSDVWRQDLFNLIDATGYIGGLEWLLLTKRPENLSFNLPDTWKRNPPSYVRIGVTCEDQENANKRIPQLLEKWKGNNFLSVEPMLGPVTIMPYLWPDASSPAMIEWVIVGGESGPGCRPFDPDWARDLHDQCMSASVAYFFKQLGGHPDKRHDPAGWPDDLRVQEFPD